MNELKENELLLTNGGMNFYNWALATAGECGFAAAACGEVTPAAAGLCCAGAIYSAWN
jgi:hypothetical protein